MNRVIIFNSDTNYSYNCSLDITVSLFINMRVFNTTLGRVTVVGYLIYDM